MMSTTRLGPSGSNTGKSPKDPVAIERPLAHSSTQAKLLRKMEQHVFHRPGNSARRITNVILKAADLRQASPHNVERLELELSVAT